MTAPLSSDSNISIQTLFEFLHLDSNIARRQVSRANTGFKDALNLMNMESVAAAGGLDEEVTVTPAPKKPKLTHQIAKALEITPPPVGGRQSVPRRKKLVLGLGDRKGCIP